MVGEVVGGGCSSHWGIGSVVVDGGGIGGYGGIRGGRGGWGPLKGGRWVEGHGAEVVGAVRVGGGGSSIGASVFNGGGGSVGGRDDCGGWGPRGSSGSRCPLCTPSCLVQLVYQLPASFWFRVVVGGGSLGRGGGGGVGDGR